MWQQVEQFFIHAAILWIIPNFIYQAITLTSAEFCAHIEPYLAFLPAAFAVPGASSLLAPSRG